MTTATSTQIRVKPKAFPYIRWSSDPQTWGDSERRQNELANSYCAREGLEIQEPFIAKGESAWKGHHRKEGGAFAALLSKTNAGDFILIESNDRFSREDALTALTALKEIVARGVTMVFLDTGLKVTKENFFKMEVILPNFLKSLLANMEVERKSGMVESGWKKLKEGAAEGIIMTKATPAWLSADYDTNKFTEVELHVTTLRRIFDEYANGKGIRTIMRELNAENIPSFGRGKQNKGNGWSNSHLRRLLASRNVLGEYQPHKHLSRKKRVPEGSAVPNYYPQIIKPAIFYEVQRILERNGHPSGPRDNVTNLFTGTIKCDRCGGSMIINQSGIERGRYHYTTLRCSNGVRNKSKCGHSSIQYKWVERAVLTILWSNIVPLMMERDNGRDELVSLNGELAHTEKKLAACAANLMNDDLVSDTALRMVKNLETKRAELKLEIEARAARLENNPLAGWVQVPQTKENRLRLQTIMADEIAALTIDTEKLTGTLKVRDPETEFDLTWKRGENDTFQSIGKTFHYLDEVLVWKTAKNVPLELMLPPLEEAA